MIIINNDHNQRMSDTPNPFMIICVKLLKALYMKHNNNTQPNLIAYKLQLVDEHIMIFCIFISSRIFFIFYFFKPRVDQCGIVRSILHLSNSRNEGGHNLQLCQSLAALNTTDYSCTSGTYASNYSCAKIFFSCFNTSLSFSQHYCYQPLLPSTSLHM